MTPDPQPAPSVGTAGATCKTCNGRGVVGGHTGQTPETYEEITEPCPDCGATGHWWCPSCKQEVDATNVTFSEHHDGCGQRVEWIEPAPSVGTAGADAETPRTNAAINCATINESGDHSCKYVTEHFARALERDLARVTQERDEANKEVVRLRARHPAEPLLSAVERANQNLADALAAKTAELERVTQENERLRQQFSEDQKLIGRIKHQRQDKIAEVAALRSDVERLKGEVESQSVALSARHERIVDLLNERDQLRSRVEELGAKVAALEADRERLDWLEQRSGRFANIDRITSEDGKFNSKPTLRASIDAARAAEQV